MKIIKGDLFKTPCDAVCITTNGVVKNNGAAVMGAGVAKIFRDKYPKIDRYFGNLLANKGHHVQVIWYDVNWCQGTADIISFPTKNHWKDPSSLELIEKSCIELAKLMNEKLWFSVISPMPGCSNGGLKWKDVKPICEKYLNDRFYIIDYRR